MTDYLLRIWTPFCTKPVQAPQPFRTLEAAQTAYDKAVQADPYTQVQLRERQGNRSDRVIAERVGTPCQK